MDIEVRAKKRAVTFLKRAFCKIYNLLKEKHGVICYHPECLEVATEFLKSKIENGEKTRDSEIRSHLEKVISAAHRERKSQSLSDEKRLRVHISSNYFSAKGLKFPSHRIND